MKKFSLIIGILAFITLAITNGTNELSAKRNGKTGATNNNSKSCGECHSANPNTNVNVAVTSETGLFVVAPESKTKFTLTVTSPSGSVAGCNIAVKTQLNGNISAGTLEAINGSGLAVSQKELIHTQPKTLSGGKTSFDFYWTAPKELGVYYLQAVALTANGNNSADNGDIWNFAPIQVIEVKTPNSINIDNYNKPFLVYPNPLNSFSRIIINNIETFSKIENIRIIDISGAIIASSNKDIQSISNSFSKLEVGIYFIQYQIEGSTYTDKIIKIN